MRSRAASFLASDSADFASFFLNFDFRSWLMIRPLLNAALRAPGGRGTGSLCPCAAWRSAASGAWWPGRAPAGARQSRSAGEPLAFDDADESGVGEDVDGGNGSVDVLDF